MSTRFRIASLVYMMANAVLFGIGLLSVLLIPGLDQHALRLIPLVVVCSFLLAAPIAWAVAPRLTARYMRNHEA